MIGNECPIPEQDDRATSTFRAMALANVNLAHYNVYMANRSPVSSAPLFGAATPSQIREIQARIACATAKHARTKESATAILEKVGALPKDTAGA
jgi:hypothetical protein